MKPNNCKTRVNTADRTDTGNVRKSNQDVGLNMTAPRAPLNADALLAVADGMGGHASGELASRMAIEELVNCLNSSSKSKSSVARMLENAVKHANSAVHKAGMAPAHMGMGTTLTAAIIAKFNLYVANVGDSRCYLLRGNCLRQVTQDHSYVAEQVLAGNLTEEEARQHPARNMITRAIGLEPRVEVDVFPPIPLRKGDRVLICSDGLYSMVRDTEIMNILRRHKPELACKKLVELANANGGNDNITVAVGLIEKTGKPGKTERNTRKRVGTASTVKNRGGKPGHKIKPLKVLRKIINSFIMLNKS